MTFSTQLQQLLDKGVQLPHPASVWISEEVDPERIHASAVIHPGCRIQGELTSIGPDVVLGAEAPVTLIHCQLGKGVQLKGGFFEGSVFLEGSSVGASAHVRPGCLFEEEASAAHAVGLKQTILFPFVTLGSLINFCDVMMSGGTSRKNHSEVGSSFIHFNFTPHNDKATASLIGDISKGVLLNQPPIFLGGQGGIVGPVEMTFGVIQAAGSICRQDLLEPGFLYQSAVPRERWEAYRVGAVRDPESKWAKNVKYIASLSALRSWYQYFRLPLMSDDPYTVACLQGAIRVLDAAIAERMKQVRKWLGLLPEAEWQGRWRALEAVCQEIADSTQLQSLVDALEGSGETYIQTVKQLTQTQQQHVQDFFETEIQRFAVLTASS
ncbi:hypothetical protein P3T73_07710 [Kiritimatiellota bacterium B12222]|nr:hypothetical protein P3T73_07710 [Kiritimatiellota bacterium B12222]